MNRSPILSLVLAVALSLAAAGTLRAHEGHVHEDEPAAALVEAPAGASRYARSDAFELLVRAAATAPGEPTALRLLVADDATNAPIAGAGVEITPPGGDTTWTASAVGPGVYEATASFPGPGFVRLDVLVRHGEELDLLTVDSLWIGPAEAGAAAATRRAPGPWMWGALAAIVLGISAALLSGRARRRSVPPAGAAGLVLLLALAALGSRDARGHEGELHGDEVAAPKPAGGSAAAGPARGVVPAGARYVAKEAQFELGLLTEVAHEEDLVETRQAFGTVVPEASARAEILAPQSGRFVGRRAFQVGDRVSRGQALGAILVVDELPVRAPIGGTLAEVSVVPGQTVAAGQSLATVVDLARVRVEVPLHGDALVAGLAARTATVRLPALPGVDFAGRVVGLAPAAREGGGPALPLVLAVANPRALLRPGMVVEVALAGGTAVSGVSVPAAAVLTTEEGPAVFVKIAPEAFVRRPVTLGPRSGDRVGLLAGVAPGERVVVAGGSALLATAEAPR